MDIAETNSPERPYSSGAAAGRRVLPGAPSGSGKPGGPERRWSRERIALAAALWLVGAVALALLAVFAHSDAVFPGDVGIAEAVQSLHWQPLVRFINLSSDANWPYPAGITVIVVVVALVVALRFRAAICAAVAGFAADLVNVTLNGVVARPRPNNVHVHVVAHLGLHSFPSGHVTHVVSFYGFLFYLSYRAWKRASAAASGARSGPSGGWLAGRLPVSVWRGFLAVVMVVSAYFLIFIGPSRVLEGEHWPSDVVASYLLGALALVVVIALYHALTAAWRRIEQRRHGAPLARAAG